MKKISKNQSGFTLVEGLLILLIVVVLGGIGYMVYHNNHKTNSGASNYKTASTSSSETNSLTENYNNTARTNDANSILAAYTEFQNNNESAPPTTVTPASASSAYLCASTSCVSTNSSLVNLGFYKPKNISILGNSGALTVPNDNVVYIMGGATCLNKQTAERARDGASTVVVYALQNGSGITQQCISI